jgi:hypothetical protein
MFMSRQLVKPAARTKFRKQAEEEMKDKQRKKHQERLASQKRGYREMEEEDLDNGC